MARKNIFQIINEQNNPCSELNRIEEMLNDETDGVYVFKELFASMFENGEPTSILKYIDQNLFRTWKQRGTCISTLDMKRTAGIDDVSEAANDIHTVLLYCEYAANLVFLLKTSVDGKDTIGNTAYAVYDNIKIVIGRYGFEIKEFEEDERVLIVTKDAAATAVSEILDISLATLILEYNHFLLKGNIDKKKSILVALGNDLESKRKKLDGIDKDLTNNIFFMLNNMNIRHNNRKKSDSTKYKPYVAKMKKAKLEEWYDELYQMILLAYLQLDNEERKTKVEDLKTEVNKKENENG